MLRVRRLASLAVAATLTVAGLSACRVQPDVAVYYGAGTQFSVAEVQRVFDDARTKLETIRNTQAAAALDAAEKNEAGLSPEDKKTAVDKAEAAATKPVTLPITGPKVVGTLVVHDLLTRLAKERNVAVPATLPLEDAAKQVGLPSNAEYVRLYTEYRVLSGLIFQDSATAAPSDADLRPVFDTLQAAGAFPPDVTYDQFKTVQDEQIQQLLQNVAGQSAVKKELEGQLDELNVKVNPRFAGAEIDLYSVQMQDGKEIKLITVPLTESESAPVTSAG